MYFDIFQTFFKIGLFTIGGGYAMIPVIQKEVVETKKWLTEEEFLDSIAVTNSLPGPLAINCAVFIGYKKKRILGSLTAVSGAILPSFLIILFIAMFFSKIRDYKAVEYIFAGVRPAVVALILYAVIKLMKSVGINKINISIALASLLFILLLDIHPIIVIIISGVSGFFLLRKEVAPSKGAAPYKGGASK